MKIIRFDGALVEESDLTYKSQDTPLGRLVENVIQAAAAIQDGDIEVVLIDNREAFDFWSAPEGSLGFHAINSGIFEEHDHDVLATAHRVVILVNEDEFIAHFEEEIGYDCADRRDEYLDAYLITVTHELTHCLEFIQNGNGLTPSEAQNLYDAGELEYSVTDLATGHGILFPFNASLSESQRIAIMEDRVEAKGRKWFFQCQLDRDLYDAVIEHYTPENFSFAVA